MTGQQSDFLDGLHVVETELERVIGELDEVQDRLSIHPLNRVSLWPLQWAINKLADDLHDADTELRNARLEVASAQREASEAQQQTEEMKGRHELQSVYSAGQAGRIAGLEGVVESLTAERERLQQQVAELTKNLGELEREKDLALSRLGDIPEIPECPCCGDPGYRRDDGLKCETCGTDWCDEAKADQEPYPWQIGDEIECNGVTRRKVIDRREGWVFLEGVTSPLSQPDWERRGWKLHRKALPLPDIPPFTPQQMADFTAAVEQVSDSVDTDGEGQS